MGKKKKSKKAEKPVPVVLPEDDLDDIQEYVEEDLPEMTLEELLSVYLQACDRNKKNPPYPLLVWEVYTGLQDKYPEPADFADALSRLLDSNPRNNMRGYSLEIEMKGDDFKTIAFRPVNGRVKPIEANGNGRKQEIVPSKPAAQKEEKVFSQLMDELRENYDKALQLQKEADRIFHENEVKRLVAKARWEAGRELYMIEQNLRSIMGKNPAAEAGLADLRKLREGLGYKTN